MQRFFTAFTYLKKEVSRELDLSQCAILVLLRMVYDSPHKDENDVYTVGIPCIEFSRRLDVTPPAIQRALKTLTYWYERDKDGNEIKRGFDLIELRSNPGDGHEMVACLNERGLEITEMLKKIIHNQG